MTRYLITYVSTGNVLHQFEVYDHEVARQWLSYGVEQGFTHLQVRPILDPVRARTWRDRLSPDDLVVAVIILLAIIGLMVVGA